MQTSDHQHFILIRSDTGDGGWSLHLSADEASDGVPSRILLSGKSDLVDDEWARPNAEDWAHARKLSTK